ncbi:hypothetical protein [Caulobacter sp. DWP3-1-3b2]|uniref:hypothetical protein n=1 Tax=Caulobacter sp. DWP3-1-3b2 TaxID=2804643 RepID=UPI003CF42C61
MYQSEFPVETPVPIFDPTLLAGIALVVAAVAILTYYVGKHVGGRGRDDRWRDVPRIIHEAIKLKCVAATSAPSGELFWKAQDLVEEVQRRVGPILMFGGPCAKALKGVSEALKGEPVEEKPKEKDKSKGAHDKKDDKHGGHGHGHDAHGASHKAETELELTAANVTILGGQTLVLTGRRPGHEPDHGHDEHKDEEPKVLDHKDYARQVRMAVVEFSDFWSRGDCLKELERCQKVLTHTDPTLKRLNERRSHEEF